MGKSSELNERIKENDANIAYIEALENLVVSLTIGEAPDEQVARLEVEQLSLLAGILEANNRKVREEAVNEENK